MTRPPWEVADIIHRAGIRFIERYRSSLTWATTSKCSGQSNAAVQPHSAAIAINAFVAGIGPSLTTPAETATVRNARPTHGKNGCVPGNGSSWR